MLHVKVKEGDEVKQIQPEGIAISGDKAVIAIPVQAEKIGEKGEDGKHEVDVLAAAPGEGTDPKAAAEAAKAAAAEKGVAVPHDKAKPKDGYNAPRKDLKDGKIKRPEGEKPFDPMREAELLAKMVAAGQTPPGVGMEDVKLAFKALEAAAAGGKTDAGGQKKEQTPVIWTWHDRCETWRWRNFEAKLHEVGPGGWEERDWKVFADDRGCEEFDEDEAWVEVVEQDVHDWSC